MARNESPPFPRGMTYMNGDPDALSAPSSTNTFGQQIEGKDWVFEDVNPTLNSPVQRTNHYVRCRACRNMNPITAQAGLVVLRLDTAAGLNLSQFSGYCDLTAQDVLGVVDEYLPSTGCVQYDICWVVMEGPTIVLTPLDGGADNVFSIGGRVVALTAATSGATTSGRVAPQSLTGVTLSATEENQIMNVIGRAMSAATTANTNAQLLIYVGRF